jgi:hypothetical protein
MHKKLSFWIFAYPLFWDSDITDVIIRYYSVSIYCIPNIRFLFHLQAEIMEVKVWVKFHFFVNLSKMTHSIWLIFKIYLHPFELYWATLEVIFLKYLKRSYAQKTLFEFLAYPLFWIWIFIYYLSGSI